jgi:hypothetical protein
MICFLALDVLLSKMTLVSFARKCLISSLLTPVKSGKTDINKPYRIAYAYYSVPLKVLYLTFICYV